MEITGLDDVLGVEVVESASEELELVVMLELVLLQPDGKEV